MAEISHANLKAGQRIKITQTVRVGRRTWPATAIGIVREVRMLITGLTIQRAADDLVAVPTVHFTKDNGELSSITIDENTKIEVLE